MASLEGQTLGQYKVIAQMGSGGMATVYKAYQERLDRYVAIKMLHEAFQEDQNFLARFEREAKIVARLEHPHVVQVFDYDNYNGRPYLVMKFVEGRTLKAELDDMPPTMDEALRLMKPIADALDYAHRQGVLHRDIKPSNIIIDTNGTPYLTDFGLARMALLGESTLSQDVLLGTPNYISPEQAMGSREIDSRTDLYSLGVVLYELVSGRVPFSADTPFAVIHDQIYRELPPPSTVNPQLSPAVDAVLIKALAKQPADRYATATEMVEALKRAVETSDVPAQHSAAPVTPSRAQPRPAPVPPAPPKAPPAPHPPMMESDDDEDRVAPRAPRVNASYEANERPKITIDIPGIDLPSRHDMRKAQRAARKEAKREARRVIEHQFDLGNTSDVIENAGQAVRQVIQGIGDAFENSNYDPDLVPIDDEQAIRRRVEAQFNKRKELWGHLTAFVVVNVAMWGIFTVTGGFPNGFPWPLIVLFGWGSGMAAHLIETYYATGRRAMRRLRIIQDEFYRVYGPDWPRADRKELKRIRQRVTEPMTKRREFAEHLAVYLCINLMLWIIYITTGFLSGIPWPLIVMFGWGIGLAIHASEAIGAGSRVNAIERAVARERDAIYGSEKLKNDRFSDSQADQSLSERGTLHVRLTEDGEFTDSMIRDIEQDEKPKRSQQSRS